MSFHYPRILFSLFPFAALVLLTVWARWRRRRDILRLGDWRLIQQLVTVRALARRRHKDVMALLGVLFVIIAAAGPQFGNRLKEVKHRGVDVFIAVDTSRSMLAEDVAPSRLERAKRSLGLLIQKLEGNRVGIIAFAKNAIVQCPLTTDNEASHMFLEIIDENTVPSQGTSIGEAIRLALQSFPKDDKTGRAIVLLTDGEDHQSDPIGAAKMAKEAGVTVFTIGIGTSKGEVIKNRDAQGKVVEFHKYKGEMVVSRLDDASLTKIAMMTDGHYYRASSTDEEIDEIANILNGMDKKLFATKIYERLEERYQFFALLAFLILLWEFFYGENPRQWARVMTILRTQTILTVVLICLSPQMLRADVKTHLRKGNKLLQQGDFAGARMEFESARIDAPEEAILPYNVATTYYLEGHLEEARKNYETAMALAKDPAIKSKIAYNWGHLLFGLNERDAAVEKFKESLRLAPKDADAKYNIEYILAGHQPQATPQKSPDPEKKQKGESDKSDKDSPTKGEQQEETDNQQQKEGSMSKEDAERVLQMLQAQESEKIKDSKPTKPGIQNKEKKNETGEDW